MNILQPFSIYFLFLITLLNHFFYTFFTRDIYPHPHPHPHPRPTTHDPRHLATLSTFTWTWTSIFAPNIWSLTAVTVIEVIAPKVWGFNRPLHGCNGMLGNPGKDGGEIKSLYGGSKWTYFFPNFNSWTERNYTRNVKSTAVVARPFSLFRKFDFFHTLYVFFFLVGLQKMYRRTHVF